MCWAPSSRLRASQAPLQPFFKPELRAREEDLFNEAVVQYVADTFAQDFNRKPTSRKVAFLAARALPRFAGLSCAPAATGQRPSDFGSLDFASLFAQRWWE